jgi:hypothetical protein
VSGATAHPGPKRALKPLAVTLKFTRMGSAWTVTTDGRYVMLTQRAMPGQPVAPVALIDEQSRSRVALPTPDAAFGGPWAWWLTGPVLSGTKPQLTLYDLATGQQRTVTVQDPFCEDYGGDCTPGPVGADWLEYSESCYHCTTHYVVQNVQTGTIARLPSTGPTTVADLDSSTLTRRLCAPLRTTAHNDLLLDSSGAPSVSGAPLGGFAEAYNAQGKPYLERCGTHLRYRLPWYPITANAHALLDYPRARQITGLFLPSLRPFTIPLPKPLRGRASTVILSDHSLWITTTTNQLWVAPAPLAPTASHRSWPSAPDPQADLALDFSSSIEGGGST